MAKLTDVSCEYTGGGIYVFTAKLNDEVWFMTDFQTYDSYGCYDSPLDVVEADILPDGCINYDGHWKTPSFPLPQWVDILHAVKESCGDDVADDIYRLLPANAYCRVGEETLPDADPHTRRLEDLALIIETFEDFLEEKGIDIPNEERDEDPCGSLIYGTDYGILSDRIEELLIRLGYMKEEVQ